MSLGIGEWIWVGLGVEMGGLGIRKVEMGRFRDQEVGDG